MFLSIKYQVLQKNLQMTQPDDFYIRFIWLLRDVNYMTQADWSLAG